MPHTASHLQQSLTHPLLPLRQVNIAIQEHMRLRNTITALRGYKEELVILNPESKPGQSSEAEPFSKWLEEDPAEAFLTFDQELSAHAEEAKPGTSSGLHRKTQSIPAGDSLDLPCLKYGSV